MSEEEKKAIELLKKLQKKTPYIIWGDGTPYNKSNQIQTVLNLIEKQQKEIVRLRNIKRKDIQDLINNENENIYKNYISKDKIRAKVIEVKNRNVKDEFITASQGTLNTIIDIESLLESD